MLIWRLDYATIEKEKYEYHKNKKQSIITLTFARLA